MVLEVQVKLFLNPDTMVVNILCIIWILFIVTLLYILAKSYKKSIIFPFKDLRKSDIPYITLEIQGKPFNMIVDTGCGISIISKESLESLNYDDSTRKVNLQALTSDTLQSNVVKIPISLNKEVLVDFVVYENSDFGGFNANGININGLLGSEFFEEMKCRIDYGKHALIIP